MLDALTMTADAWHDWRQAGIGGSDIAALVGLSRYASPTSLYYEKSGLLPRSTADTERQRIGRRMETVLAEEFADRTGLHCVGQQSLWVHPDYPFARCTVDGLAIESDPADDDPNVGAVLGTVQFKTDGRFGWTEGVPPNIRAQCIWEMGITGYRMSWLVVMFAGFRVEVFEIPFDNSAQADWQFMLDTAQTFWTQHVTKGNPPPADDHPATTEALDAIYTPRSSDASFFDATDDDRDLVDRVRDAAAATKAAEATENALRNQLRDVIGNDTDMVGGYGAKGEPIVIASWRPQTAHRVDLFALRKSYPDLVEVYTNEQPSRVLRLHKPKGVK